MPRGVENVCTYISIPIHGITNVVLICTYIHSQQRGDKTLSSATVTGTVTLLSQDTTDVDVDVDVAIKK